MALLARVRRALVGPEVAALHAEIAALRASVRELDEQQVRRELEWADVAERLKRYLSRITTVEQRMKEHSGAHEADPVTSAVLRMKFPPKQNGG